MRDIVYNVFDIISYFVQGMGNVAGYFVERSTATFSIQKIS